MNKLLQVYIFFNMNINIKKYRYAILLCSLLLSLFGLFMVKEASLVWAKYLYNDELYFFKRQLIYLLIGIILFFIASSIRLDKIKKYSIYFLVVTIVLLVLVLIPGLGVTKNGSTSWLGNSSFSIQPSEFLKLTLIMYFAYYLENNYDKTNRIKTYIPIILIVITSFSLIMLQPDFGSALIIFSGVGAMLFSCKIKMKYIIILLGVIIVGGVTLVLLEDYRIKRITAFIDPFQDALGSGFQIIQSLFALGPGGLVGKGIEGSVQKHYYLPEPQTDFIFAVIVEEFGLVGGLIIILLYSILFYSSYIVIKNSTNVFKGLLYLGLLSIFTFQVLINLGVVIGLLPVTGITLPLISYGGSSLTIELFSLGLIYGDK